MGDHRLFKDFSTEELEKEILRRKNAKPERLDQPNWSAVMTYMTNAVLLVEQGMGLADDFEDRLKVLVLEAMYGKDILKWWNHKLNSK